MNPYLPSSAVSQTPSRTSAAPAPPYDGASPIGRPEVTDATLETMRQTKPWVLVMGVMSLVGAAFMCLGGVALMALGALMPRNTAAGPVPNALLGIIYVPLALLYIYPGIKLWAYGKAIGQLMVSRASSDLEAALGHQKSFWKFVGILSLCVVALYVLVFTGAMVAGMAGAARAPR